MFKTSILGQIEETFHPKNVSLESVMDMDCEEGLEATSVSEEIVDADFQDLADESNLYIKVYDHQTSRYEIPTYFSVSPNQKNLESFERIGQIGSGSFGKVFLVKEKKTKIQCAMKIVSKRRIRDMQDVYHIKNERELLDQVSGLNFLPELYWAFEDDEAFYFVMKDLNMDLFELMSKGLTNWKRDQKRVMLAELVLALDRLHQMNIVFGDLKLENVMFDAAGHVVLTDFGLSRVLPPDVEFLKKQVGTMEYMAPELFNQEPEFGKAVDFWAFGLIYYEVMSGEAYFKLKDQTISEFGEYLKNLSITFNRRLLTNEEDYRLCTQLVQKDKRRRITNWYNVKNSPAFKDISWIKVAKKQYSLPIVPKEVPLTNARYHSYSEPRSKFFFLFKNFKNFYYSFKD